MKIKMKKILKYTGNIVTTILLVLMIILVFFSVSSKLSSDGSSKLGNYRMMIVLSGSMNPIFNTGDVVFISTSKKEQYNKGDIITFKDPENSKKIVTHRIVEVVDTNNQLSYRTKGDANNSIDPNLVSNSNLIGQEKFHIPFLGRIVEFGKTKLGIILLILIPSLLIIVGELRNIIKTITEETEKKHETETINHRIDRIDKLT